MTQGGALEVIDDCGHMAPLEAPERVAEAMLGWLRAPSERAEDRHWAS